MKMDKEFVLKHKFWLLLGGGALFMLIGIFVLFVVVPRAIAKIKKDVETKWGSFKSVADVKNEKYVEKAKKEAEVEEKEKGQVWKHAARVQESLLTWPKEVEKTYEFAKGNRATRIVIQAKEAKLAELPEDDFDPVSGTHLFHGKLLARDARSITVEGRPLKGSKKTKPQDSIKKFYRTPKIVILTPEDKDKGIAFPDLPPYVGSLVAVTYDRGIYSFDELTDDEQDSFRKSYKSQILEVLKEAGPVDELGDQQIPVVQFRGWPWGKGTKEPPKETPFFRWVETWNTELPGGGTANLSEEAWLAQEDLWIYRELFRLVKKANDYVAEFEQLNPQAKGKQPPPNLEGGKQPPPNFEGENPYWKLSASLLGNGKLKIRLTNKLDRLQGLGVRFAAKLTPDGKYVLLPPINSVALLPTGTKKTWMEEDDDTKKTVTDPSLTRDIYQGELDLSAPATGIYGVRQVLTWDAAAVRRIDQINIGTAAGNEWAISHRLSFKPLFFKKGETAATDTKEDPKGPPGPGRFGKGMPGGNQPVTRTLNGLVRDRYLEKTPEARRVPVEIALIVDQAHVGRVQAAFANSPLRFLTTQLTVQRYPGSLRPLDETQFAAESKGGAVGPGAGRPAYFQGPGGRPPPGRFTERTGFRPTTPSSLGAPSSAVGGDEQESNVELVLYGVVSIYERFPPRRAADAQPKQ